MDASVVASSTKRMFFLALVDKWQMYFLRGERGVRVTTTGL